MVARALDYMALDAIKVDPRNPKAHADADIDASVGRFGYVEPIMLDERTGQIIAGHGRLASLQRHRARGGAPPEGVEIRDGEWCAPVIRGWSSHSDEEAAAFLIASNRLTEKGGWNNDPLVALLSELQNATDGLIGTGFTSHDVDDLIASFGAPPSLDDLANRHGEPDDEKLWPVLRFKVPPTMRDRYLRLVEGRAGSDADLFGILLDRAEATT